MKKVQHNVQRKDGSVHPVSLQLLTPREFVRKLTGAQQKPRSKQREASADESQST